MNKPVLAAERIQSLDISLNDLAVGTLVRRATTAHSISCPRIGA